jgi:hypothetical protein
MISSKHTKNTGYVDIFISSSKQTNTRPVINNSNEHQNKNNSRLITNNKLLSRVLSQTPAGFDGSKLNLVNSTITTIDKLPNLLCLKVKTLYISNNNISSSEGIEQFTNLQSLSMSNNLIRYLNELLPLSKLKHLEKISLEGNIVTAMPYYREYLLGLCPNLQLIDAIKVTNIEKSNSKSSSRKAISLFSQLRVNELQCCILRHLSGLIKCHNEMSKVVRILKGPRIHSSAAFILTQALLGGVYAWLQTMCELDFDHMVQNLSRRAYLNLLRQMNSVQRSQITHTPSALNLLWDETVTDCLSYQQNCSLRLIEICEYELSLSKTLPLSDLNHEPIDFIDTIHCIKFESIHSDGVLNLYSDDYERSGSYGSSSQQLYQQSPPPPSNRDLNKDDRNNPNKDNKGNNDKNNNNKLRKSPNPPSSTATNMSPQELKNQDTQLKYFQLLQQMEQNNNNSSANSVILSNLAVGSSFLPPQQVEPESYEEGAELINKNESNEENVSDDNDMKDYKNFDIDFDFDLYSNDITELVTRASTSCPDPNSLPILEWKSSINTNNNDNNNNDNNNDISLSNPLPPISFGPIPQPYDRPVEEKDMRLLKRVVNDAYHELTLRQRDSGICLSLNQNQRKLALEAKKILKANIENATKRLNSVKNWIGEIHIDIANGTRWVNNAGSLISSIEVEQLKVKRIKTYIEGSKSQCNTITNNLQQELLKKTRLLNSLSDINVAMESIDVEFGNNKEIRDLIKSHRSIDNANTFWKTKGCLWLKRAIFKSFRIRVRRQKLISIFAKKLKSNKRLSLINIVMSGWKRYILLNKEYELIYNVLNIRLLKKIFKKWQNFHKKQLVIMNFKLKCIKNMKRMVVKSWKHYLRKLEKNISDEKYYKTAHQFMFLKKVFRSLKSHAISCRPEQDPIKDSNNILKSLKFYKSKFFNEWKNLSIINQENFNKYKIIIKAKINLNTTDNLFMQWYHLSKSIHRCVLFGKNKFIDKLFKYSYSVYHQRISFLRSKLYHDRKSKRNAFKFLKFIIKRDKLCSRNYHIVSKNRTERMIINSWIKWSMLYESNVEMEIKDCTSIQHYMFNLLKNSFADWNNFTMKKILYRHEISNSNRDYILNRVSAVIDLVDDNNDDLVAEYDNNSIGDNNTVPTLSELVSSSNDILMMQKKIKDLQELGKWETSDDEDDNVFKAMHSSHFSVRIHSLLTRWRLSTTRSKQLKENGELVESSRLKYIVKRNFSSMHTQYLRLLRCRTLELKNDVIGYDIINKKENLKQNLSEDLINAINQQREIESLMLKLSEVTSEIDTTVNESNDLCASLHILTKENDNLISRTDILNKESSEILSLYSQISNNMEMKLTHDGNSADSYDINADDVSHKVSIEDSISDSNRSQKHLALEEKIFLMHDMEECYNKALQIQVDAAMQKSELSANAAVAINKTILCKNEIVNIDKYIEELEEKRKSNEELLLDYQNKLEDSSLQYAEMAKKNESYIYNLSLEEEDLRLRQIKAMAEEELLREELNNLTKETNKYMYANSRLTTVELSKAEIDAVDYRGHSIAHLTSFTSKMPNLQKNVNNNNNNNNNNPTSPLLKKNLISPVVFSGKENLRKFYSPPVVKSSPYSQKNLNKGNNISKKLKTPTSTKKTSSKQKSIETAPNTPTSVSSSKITNISPVLMETSIYNLINTPIEFSNNVVTDASSPASNEFTSKLTESLLNTKFNNNINIMKESKHNYSSISSSPPRDIKNNDDNEQYDILASRIRNRLNQRPI